MAYVGLIVEILLLALGVYLYLFARGLLNAKSGDQAEKMEQFRQENASWMRLLGLALAAVMLLNIFLRITTG